MLPSSVPVGVGLIVSGDAPWPLWHSIFLSCRRYISPTRRSKQGRLSSYRTTSHRRHTHGEQDEKHDTGPFRRHVCHSYQRPPSCPWIEGNLGPRGEVSPCDYRDLAIVPGTSSNPLPSRVLTRMGCRSQRAPGNSRSTPKLGKGTKLEYQGSSSI